MWKSFGAFSGGFLEVWFWLLLFLGIAVNGVLLIFAAIVLLLQWKAAKSVTKKN